MSKSGRGVRSDDASDGAYNNEEKGDFVVGSLEEITVEHEWCLLLLNGPLPVARTKHAAVIVGRRMFIVGGTSGQTILDDVQVFHAEKLVWLQLDCWSSLNGVQSTKDDPADSHGRQCAGHSVAFWEKQLVVVGGHIEPSSKKITVLSLDLGSLSWSCLTPKGDIPVSRTGQSVVQVGSMLVMFGGEDAKGRPLNDLHILDLKALVWLPLKTTGAKPSPRTDHSAACYSERYLWIFGGKSKTTYFSDVYYLDFQSMEWTKEKTRGLSPTARAGHAGVIAGNKWYIVGGEFRGNEVLEMLALDLDTHEWSVIAIVRPGSPLANDGITVVKLSSKGKVFLIAFGGHEAIQSSQVYVMLLPPSKHLVKRLQVGGISELFSNLSASFNYSTLTLPAAAKDSPSAHSGRTSDASSVDLDVDSGSLFYPGVTSVGHSSSSRRSIFHSTDHQEMEIRGSRDRDQFFYGDDVAATPNTDEAAFWIRKVEYESQANVIDQMQLIQLSDNMQLSERAETPNGMFEERRLSIISGTKGFEVGMHTDGRSEIEDEPYDNDGEMHEKLITAFKINEELQSRLVETWNSKDQLERMLSATLSEKDDVDRKLAAALFSIQGLEKQIQIVLKSKADEEIRLQEALQNLEEMDHKLLSASQVQEDLELRLQTITRQKEDVEKKLSLSRRIKDEAADSSSYWELERIVELQTHLEESEKQIAGLLKNQALMENKLKTAQWENHELQDKVVTAIHMQEECRMISRNERAEKYRLEHDLLSVRSLLADLQKELQAKEVELSQATTQNLELQGDVYELSQRLSGNNET